MKRNSRHRDHTLLMSCVWEDRIRMLDAAMAQILWQKVSIRCLLLSTLAQEEKGYLGFCLFFAKDPGCFLVIQAQWTRHQQCMCTIYNSMCLLAYMLVKFIVQCVSRKTEFSRGHELTISQGWSGGGGGGMTNQFLLCFIIHGAMGPQQYRYMQENHGSLGYGLTVTGMWHHQKYVRRSIENAIQS